MYSTGVVCIVWYIYIYSVEVSLVEVWRCTCTNLLQIILQHIPSYYTYHTNGNLAIHYDA